MLSAPLSRTFLVALAVVILPGIAGCHDHTRPIARPLGSISDSIWQMQEANAERSDFVVYESEFTADSEFLNTGGEDHLKQIAFRLATCQDAQVLVERSRTSARVNTAYHYRVHPNPDLDMRRRQIVVLSLLAMGIADAEARVVVAPSPAPKYRAGDAVTAGAEQGQNYGGFGGFFFNGFGR